MGLRGPIPKDPTRRQGHRPDRALTVLPAKPASERAKNRTKTAKTPVPKPPKGLLSATKQLWKAFWNSPVSHAVDLAADRYRLERWINCVDEYERVNAAFKNTRIVKGSTGQPVLNPLSQYLQQLLAEINKAEAELGLTPLARMRLGVVYGEAKLTALELNRVLDQQMHEPRELEPWEAEWEPAR